MRLVAAAYIAIAVLLIAATSYLAFSQARAGGPLFWGFAVAPSVALGAVAMVWAGRRDLLREWVTPRWGDFTRGIVGAAVLFGAAWAFAHVVAPVGSPREIWLVALYGRLGDPQVLHAQAPLVAAVIILVTAAEEFLWRGMVTELLAEEMGSRLAWVGAAVLYGCAYLPTMWSLRVATTLNPLVLAAALGGGLLWGAMARAFGTLVPSIVAHAFFDWAIVMILPLWGGRLEL